MFGLRRIAFICYLVGRSDATVGRSDATLGRSDAAPQKSYRIVGATRRAAHCGASPPVMHRPGAAVPRPKNPAQPYRIVGATRCVAHCGASPTPRGASPTAARRPPVMRRRHPASPVILSGAKNLNARRTEALREAGDWVASRCFGWAGFQMLRFARMTK